MVRLQSPLIFIGVKITYKHTPHQKSTALTRRTCRHIITLSASTFDLTAKSPTYMDAKGVARGVPNEYTIADQIAVVFENLPII